MRQRKAISLTLPLQGDGRRGPVYHLASLVAITADKNDLVYKVNVEGTQNVIDAAAVVPASCLYQFDPLFGTPVR